MLDVILRRAAELVETGWTQGELVTTGTRRGYCLVGAIGEACIEADAGAVVVDAYRLTADAVQLLDRRAARRERPIPTLMAWNDTWGRTSEEVVQALNIAELIARLASVHPSVGVT